MSVYLQDSKVLLDIDKVATSEDCCCGCACCHDVTVDIEATATTGAGCAGILLQGTETRSHSFTQSCDREDFELCEGNLDLDCNDPTNCLGNCDPQHRCGELDIVWSKQCVPGLAIIVSTEMACTGCISGDCTPECISSNYFVNCTVNSYDDFPDGLPEGETVLTCHHEEPFHTGSCGTECSIVIDVTATITVGPLGSCPMGACCDEFDFCTITDEPGCAGVWQGAGTTCDPNPCVPPVETGACCDCFGIPGFCIDDTTQANCENPFVFNGTYGGNGSTCPCP